ncbi:MAG: clostripain-related cysteine peptidase [Ilumatobacteraceae bacterium]
MIVYQAADNNLEAPILTDIAEMGEVENEAVDIVVMLDRSDEYTDDDTYTGISEELDTSQFLYAGRGGVQLMASVEEVNTGDPAALASFIGQAIDAFPREHVALVLGDHGAAWRGVAYDDGAEDELTLPELSAALGQGLAAAGRDSLDIVGFDACLMATLEVGAALAPYAQFLVASEELEPGLGWDWTVLQQTSTAMDGLELSNVLAQGYQDFYADEKIISTQTMSVIDLAEIGGVDAALASLSDIAGVDATASAVGIARSAVRAYSYADDPDPLRAYNQYDIVDLVETMAIQNPALEDEAAAVKEAVKRAVVTNLTGTLSEQSAGLSIYLPPYEDVADARYFELEGLSAWQNLLTGYLATTSSVVIPPAFTDDDKFIDGLWTADGFQIASTYDAAADATVVDARLRYGSFNDDYTEMVFYGSDPLSFGNGQVSGVWDPQFLRITDGTTETYNYSTFEISGDRTRAIINVPMAYFPPGGEQPQAVQLRFVLDSTGQLISKDFVVFSTFGVGRASVDPAGTLLPLVIKQNLTTFEEHIQSTSDVRLSANIDLLDASYDYLPEATPILAQLELHALDGSTDFVYAGDAVPAFYYDQRDTYPTPG